MPKDSTAGRADLVDANLNPFFNTAVSGGRTFTFTLRFDTGRAPNLGGLHDALIGLYGAGKVTYQHDSNARGCFDLLILA